MSAFVKPAPGTKVGTTGLAASIVGYWLLGDNSSTVADSSVSGGNSGAVQPALVWGASPDATVISGGCLNGFAGVPSANTTYVDLGNSNTLNPTAAFAYEIWFYPTGLPGNAAWLLARDDVAGRSYAIGFVAGTDLDVQISGVVKITAVGSGANVVTVNKWNHIVVTGSAADGHIYGYVNGGLIATTTYTAPTTDAIHTCIGRRTFSTDQGAFLGTIGVVSIRNALILAADVTSLFTNPGIVFPAVSHGKKPRQMWYRGMRHRHSR